MTITSEAARAARITLAEGAGRAVLSPLRGALCIGWAVGGREFLYLDQATLADPTRNVRGGVPVLFPSPGKLKDGRFTAGGRSGAMGQHGFARGLPWEVVEQADDHATLRLAATPETLAQYPFRFELRYRFTVRGASLTIDQRVANLDDAPLPFASGFHPYFAVPAAAKAHARVETGATRAFDNVAGREVALGGPLDLGAGEVDLHLLDHGRSDAALALPGGARVVLRGSPEFTRWVVWTLPGKDFVCLEPWTAPFDALNTGEGLLTVPPGAARDLSLELQLAVRSGGSGDDPKEPSFPTRSFVF